MPESDNIEPLPQRRAEDIALSTKYGSIAGNPIAVIAILLLCAFIVLGVWFLQVHESTTHSLVDEMKDIKYILLMSQEKRDKIADQISMPDNLRKQMRNGQ